MEAVPQEQSLESRPESTEQTRRVPERRERRPEQRGDQVVELPKDERKKQLEPALQRAQASTPQVAPTKDPITKEIEDILSEDLGDLYANLSPEEKKRFREEGERTAGLIREMVDKGKVHARKVVGLIKKWLRLIPGVNRYFLEQEAKIKTDKILEMAEEQTMQSQNDLGV